MISNNAKHPIEKEATAREVCYRIGRNLLLFQKIEFHFKVIAPFLSKNNDATQVQPSEKIKELLNSINSRNPLGTVARRVIEAIPPDEGAGLQAYIEYIVRERNWLAHEFISHHGLGIDTVDQCKASIAYLDKQLELSKPLLDFATDLSRIVFGTAVDSIEDF